MATPKKNKFRRMAVVLILLMLVAAGAGSAYKLSRQEKPILIQTEPAARRDLTELVIATGRIQPVMQVVINPEVSGEIVELPVQEGQLVKKGDLLVRIKPDNYMASRNSAEASYKSSLANMNLAKANLSKAELEFERAQKLYKDKLISESHYLDAKTILEVMKATYETSSHQGDQAKAALARAEEDLAKTTILAPMDGTVTRLKSQRGERVVGTAMMAGTEIMTIANLDEMEARVDIGEIDIVLIKPGQKARLEIDAYRDKKFAGEVSEIANMAKTGNQALQQQDATRFEVKIRVQDKERFRPGMSVTAEVETRYRTNALTVPIQSVTTRQPKDEKEAKDDEKSGGNSPGNLRKPRESTRPAEVVFVVGDDNRARMLKVQRGISDDQYIEITEGLEEGQQVVSGSYKAINRELEDGKPVMLEGEKKQESLSARILSLIK